MKENLVENLKSLKSVFIAREGANNDFKLFPMRGVYVAPIFITVNLFSHAAKLSRDKMMS